MLDNIRSAFNTGSIFRTSDTAGVTKIFLAGITPYPPHLKLQKTALGTLETVEWEYVKSSVEKVKELKEEGIPIISVEIDKRAIDYTKFKFPDKFCLVMGHELMGVNEEILDLSDAIVSIPMHGVKNSLNVAVSFGITVYESIKDGI